MDNNIFISQAAQKLASNLISDKNFIDINGIPKTRAGDELFSFYLFREIHKRLPTNALLFNDFLYRIKVTDEILNPLRVFVTDKEFAKLYVKAKLGDKYLVPTLAIFDTSSKLSEYIFPNRCCIKPTHMSGQIILREAGEPLNYEVMAQWLVANHYDHTREANYRYLKPKIIVEPLVFDSINNLDYKFFCYQGKVKLVQVHINRFSEHEQIIYDRNWIAQDYSIKYPKSKCEIPIPTNLKEMIAVAESLSEPFNFIRIDLYADNKNIYVGEITNCHGNACESFFPLIAEERASRVLFDEGQWT